MSLDEDSRSWLAELEQFVRDFRRRHPVGDLDDLSALEDEQRRISGGALIELFEFVQGAEVYDLFPKLEEKPLDQRAFVLACDRPTAAASRDVLDWDSDQAIVVLQHEWRAWVEAPDCDSDDAFERHWEVWSAWHQQTEEAWDLPSRDDGSFWVHEEGFAVADRAGRGSKHLWQWDGDSFTLEEQSVDEWVSRPDA
jgi:hypothetical protein